MIGVFLSHSSKDKELALKIAEDLRRNRIPVWLDEWEILVGDSISQRIQEGLTKMELIAVLLTKHSVASGWVEKEWQSKIGSEAVSRKVAILPLKGDECRIPPLLTDKKYADFTHDYERALSQLIDAVKSHSRKQRFGEESTISELCTILKRQKARRDLLQAEIRRICPDEDAVIFTDDLRGLENAFDELNDEIADLERKVEIIRLDTGSTEKPNEIRNSKTLTFISEGGKNALFFSLINPTSGRSFKLSSFSFIKDSLVLCSGGEDRLNLAEFTKDLGQRKRKLAAVNISTGETFVLSQRVIRIDPGDIVPFSLPVFCDWREHNIVCRLIVHLIGPSGKASVPSDCIYILGKPHRYSRRISVNRAIPVSEIVENGSLEDFRRFRCWNLKIGKRKFVIPDYLVSLEFNGLKLVSESLET